MGLKLRLLWAPYLHPTSTPVSSPTPPSDTVRSSVHHRTGVTEVYVTSRSSLEGLSEPTVPSPRDVPKSDSGTLLPQWSSTPLLLAPHPPTHPHVSGFESNRGRLNSTDEVRVRLCRPLPFSDVESIGTTTLHVGLYGLVSQYHGSTDPRRKEDPTVLRKSRVPVEDASGVSPSPFP